MVLNRRAQVTDAGVVELMEGESAAGGAKAQEVDVEFIAKNKTGTASIYVGPEDLTAGDGGTGFEWAPADGPLIWKLRRGEQLFARLAAGAAAQTVHILARTL